MNVPYEQVLCVYPKPDIAYSSVAQRSTVVQKLLNTSVSHNVTLSDTFLYYHEHTHSSLFLIQPHIHYTVLLPQILIRAPNVY